jgi:hypothetical protein
MAARLHAARRHAGFGVLHVVDDALAILEERRAFEGQRELARRAHQQLHAEPLLERVEAAADDRRRDAFARGRRQAALAATAANVSICLNRSMTRNGDGAAALQFV